MSVIICNKYKILDQIGEGTFGKVFKGQNIRTEEEIAIKIQYKGIANVLKHEAKIYKHIKDISGIPHIRNYGSEFGFSYLILDLLGPSLFDIKITPEKALKFLLKAVNIIEYIHDIGIIHRDIKPDNFLLLNSDSDNLYLIDFGLSKYYFTPNKKHMEERKDRKLIGTAKFSSLNVHNGIEASRRDDMESLCYAFISIFGKELPWSNILDGDNNSDSLVGLTGIPLIYFKMKKIKEGTLTWLYDIPGEFLTILLYCRKLEFSQRPNYNYIRGIIENLLKIY